MMEFETRIDNRRYNTKKARLLASDKYGDGFRSCEDYLYRKRTGEYFLCGRGGPESHWAESCDDGHCYRSGSGIKPLTPAEALEWAQKHVDRDEIDRIFPDAYKVQRTGTRELKTVRLDTGIVEAAKAAAGVSGQSLGAWIEAVVEAALTAE